MNVMTSWLIREYRLLREWCGDLSVFFETACIHTHNIASGIDVFIKGHTAIHSIPHTQSKTCMYHKNK